MSAGDALLLKCVTKYVSKFSDANYDEWMNDKAAANSIAWRVLKEYHPFEPEMVLQLEAANFRQWGVGTQSRGLRHLVAPDGFEITSELKAYMKSKWRHDDMSFLEFLRKTTHKGAIAGWLKKLWKERPEEQMHLTETEFANEYTMRGEQLVAVDTVWRHNDKFFRQWVLKHVPFRKKEDLDVPEVTARVPPRLRGQA
jgi:hypothetical protein